MPLAFLFAGLFSTATWVSISAWLGGIPLNCRNSRVTKAVLVSPLGASFLPSKLSTISCAISTLVLPFAIRSSSSLVLGMSVIKFKSGARVRIPTVSRVMLRVRCASVVLALACATRSMLSLALRPLSILALMKAALFSVPVVFSCAARHFGGGVPRSSILSSKIFNRSLALNYYQLHC